MLLKGKWVFVKQESLVWWQVLRCKLVIWPTAGSVVAMYPEMPPVISAGGRTLQTGALQNACETQTFYTVFFLHYRKSLENAKQRWVIPMKLSQHEYWGLLGVESWYHEVSLGAIRASHSLSKSVHAGRSGADLTVPELESATMPSLPEKLVSDPHWATTLHGRTHQPLVWAFPVAPCTAAAWRGEAGRVEGDGPCHAHRGEWREACATQQIQQPWVPISNKTFMAWSGRDTQACILARLEKEKCRKKSAILKKHDFGRVILRLATLQTSPLPLDLGTGMTRRIMAC